jgi:hypothetical protein
VDFAEAIGLKSSQLSNRHRRGVMTELSPRLNLRADELTAMAVVKLSGFLKYQIFILLLTINRRRGYQWQIARIPKS